MHPYEEEYLRLLKQYKSGALSLDEFEEKIAALQWQDETGDWYALSSGGDILKWNKNEEFWEQTGQIRLPQVSRPAPQQNEVLKSVGKGLRVIKTLLVIVSVLLLLLSAAIFSMRLFAPGVQASVSDVQQGYDTAGKTAWNIVYSYTINGSLYNKSYQLYTTFRPEVSGFEVKYLPFAPAYALRAEELSFSTAGLCAAGGVALLILFGHRSRKKPSSEE